MLTVALMRLINLIVVQHLTKREQNMIKIDMNIGQRTDRNLNVRFGFVQIFAVSHVVLL